MTPLAKYMLSLALRTFPPGQSDLSAVELSECGTDPTQPACHELMASWDGPPDKPWGPKLILCRDKDDTDCRGIWWEPCWHGWRPNKKDAPCSEKAAGAWVRRETREEGAGRLEVAMQALADAAEHLGSAWPSGPTDLGRMMLAAGGWSTGLKASIQEGRLRGPGGEVCFMDLQPKTLRTLMPWDLSRLPEPELVARVLGPGYDETRRCFDAGALLIVRARREAERRCKGYPVEYATFALYATGTQCSTPGTKERPDHLATPRFDSLKSYRSRKHTVLPDWYKGS